MKIVYFHQRYKAYVFRVIQKKSIVPGVNAAAAVAEADEWAEAVW